MKLALCSGAFLLASADPLACQPNAEQPMLPIFHIIGNVTRLAGGRIKVESINDCSGVTFYEGLYHVWHQCCQDHWDHMISKDLVHWQRLPPPIQPLNLKTWDGSISMLPREDGGPLILYDAQDGKLQLGSGDKQILGVARLADVDDKYLLNWVRAENNPVEFEGGPTNFPGQVWKNADHWNFIGQGYRFQSNDSTFHTWSRMNKMIGIGDHGGQWWISTPNSIDGSRPPASFPNRLVNVNGGEKYLLGHYNAENETFTPWAPAGEEVGREAILESGDTDWWAGQNANGRMMTVGWVRGSRGLTLLREVNYDAKTQNLVSNPLPELKRLRNSSLASEKRISLDAQAAHVIEGSQNGAASSADVNIVFSGVTGPEPVSFGACVLGNSSFGGLGIAITVSPATVAAGRVAGIEVGTCGNTMYKQNKAPGYSQWQTGWNMPGGDYEKNSSSALTGKCTADSCPCQARCRADGPQKCKAWVLQPGNRCFLKDRVPGAVRRGGMVSGVEDPDAIPAPGSGTIIDLFDDEHVTVRITPDRSMADFFVQGGRWAGTLGWSGLASRKPEDSQVILWSASQGVKADATVYGMGCGWADPSYTEHPTMLDDEPVV